MAYTKYSLTPANNTAAPPDGAPEGMLPSAVNDTMRDMMAQIRDCGDGVRDGTYTMTAVKITGGTINGATIGATTATTGKFTAVTNSALTSGRVTYAGASGLLQDSANFIFDGSNLGLGVTPSAWSALKGFQIGTGFSFGGSSVNGSISSNSFYDGANWKYITSTFATRYDANFGNVGAHAWLTAPSGTAGNAVTFTQAMTLDASGRLGIGTSSPSSPLTVSTTGVDRTVQINSTDGAGGYGAVLSLNNTGTGGREYNITSTSNADGGVGGGKLKFYDATANVTRMLIDSSGNLGLGVTPSAWGGSGQVALQIGTGTSGTANFAGGGTKTLISSNQYYNGSVNKYINNGYAQAMVLDTDSSFSWIQAASGTAGNTASFFTKMTLDASGNLLVGTTTANGRICATNDNSDYCVNTNQTGAGATKYHVRFLDNGTPVGSITSASSVTSYNVTSDQRLKTNIVDAPLGNIDSIKVRSFDWIADGSHQEYGVVAQELIEVAPYAVTKPVNPDDMMQVDYSKLVPMMIREIQDLKAEVNQLKAKIGV